jgi:hypothetical protein
VSEHKRHFRDARNRPEAAVPRARAARSQSTESDRPANSGLAIALATERSSRSDPTCAAAGDRFRPNGGVHVGLALARIQLIGEQAILKRGSPGAPRLTALGLDREAARPARQRVSAEIVALPVSCSSGSDPEAETSAARDRFRTYAATPAPLAWNTRASTKAGVRRGLQHRCASRQLRVAQPPAGDCPAFARLQVSRLGPALPAYQGTAARALVCAERATRLLAVASRPVPPPRAPCWPRDAGNPPTPARCSSAHECGSACRTPGGRWRTARSADGGPRGRGARARRC